jgi:hypothetical protein
VEVSFYASKIFINQEKFLLPTPAKVEDETKVTVKNRMISPFQLFFLRFALATSLFQGLDFAKNHLQAKAFPTSLNM